MNSQSPAEVSPTRMIKNTYILLFLSVNLLFAVSAEAEEITVNDRMDQISDAVRQRLEPWFDRQRIEYPPDEVALVAVKDEKRLKVYATDDTGDWRFVMQYQIAKLSGKPGPKLKAGDKQVPEGIYNVTHLNPASKFWLSLALNYPNSFDRRQAQRDKRKNLGGDIMLHGWWFSEGCVAVGNTASEDMFVLAKDVGIDDVSFIITPTDFRRETPAKDLPKSPPWVSDLYDELELELNKLGSDGITTETRLIAYADIAPPPAPEPSTLLGKVLRALANAAETSSTDDSK